MFDECDCPPGRECPHVRIPDDGYDMPVYVERRVPYWAELWALEDGEPFDGEVDHYFREDHTVASFCGICGAMAFQHRSRPAAAPLPAAAQPPTEGDRVRIIETGEEGRVSGRVRLMGEIVGDGVMVVRDGQAEADYFHVPDLEVLPSAPVVDVADETAEPPAGTPVWWNGMWLAKSLEIPSACYYPLNSEHRDLWVNPEGPSEATYNDGLFWRDMTGAVPARAPQAASDTKETQ